jgi:hypothetical protein
MTKKIIIALIGMAALYGCKPKDPCDSEVKSDADKYLLISKLYFDIRDDTNKQLLFTKFIPTEIKIFNNNNNLIPFEFSDLQYVENKDKVSISVKISDIIVNSLVGTGEDFQTKAYIKFKDDIDTLQIWANIKKLTCNKTYTDRLQVQQNNLPVQNLILNNGEVKYGIRQPYETIVQIIK